MSASSPARRASASRHDASGISDIASISRMTSGYDMIRRRCRGFRSPRDRGVHRRLDHPVTKIGLQLAQPYQVRRHASASTVPSRRTTAGAVTRAAKHGRLAADGAAPAAVTVMP